MDTSSSPHYSDERLAACDAAGLIDLMLRDEDRVPRNVIDECARRPEVNQLLISMLQDDSSWIEAQNPANWWLKFHAIMILGLIPSADAGMALVEVIPRISDEGDLELDDLFSGCWPVLFRNKPDEVFAAVEIAAANRSFEPFVRRVMLEVLIDAARRNQDALNARLAWAARIAADKTEEWMMRVLVGSLLLLFPREDYRPVLETLAAKQRGQEALFSRRSVINAYAMMLDAPPWEDHSDPWGFYAPEAIQARQLIAEEDPLYATDDEIDDPAPFFSSGGGVPVVRAAPKIGRNEPCPCGSGKKFKKCCLASIPHHEQN